MTKGEWIKLYVGFTTTAFIASIGGYFMGASRAPSPEVRIIEQIVESDPVPPCTLFVAAEPETVRIAERPTPRADPQSTEYSVPRKGGPYFGVTVGGEK
jgi:hypothetical protein